MTDSEATQSKAAEPLEGGNHAEKTFIEEYFEKEGLEKGKAEGIAEGLAETARAMLARGTDVAFIADVTGLSQSEINALDA